MPTPTDSPNLFPHVVDVLDRVDRHLLDIEPTPFVSRLQDAAARAYAQQGQVVPAEVIAQAVADHVAEGALSGDPAQSPATQGPPGKHRLGWRRPVTESERVKELASLNHGPVRWLRRLHDNDDHTESSEGNAALGCLMGLPCMIVAGFGVGHLMPGPDWLGLFCGVVAAGVGLIAGIMAVMVPTSCLSERHEALQEASVDQDMRDDWMAVPAARHHVRACLRSALPILLKGDLAHLETLMADHKLKQKVQEEQAVAAAAAQVKAAEQQALRDQFLYQAG